MRAKRPKPSPTKPVRELVAEDYIRSVVASILTVGDSQNIAALLAFIVDVGIANTTMNDAAKDALVRVFLLLLPHVRPDRLDQVVQEAAERIIDTERVHREGELQDAGRRAVVS